MGDILEKAVEAVSGKKSKRGKKSKMAIYHAGKPEIETEKGLLELMRHKLPPLPDTLYSYKDGRQVAWYRKPKVAVYQDPSTGEQHVFTGDDARKAFKFFDTKKEKKGLTIKKLK